MRAGPSTTLRRLRTFIPIPSTPSRATAATPTTPLTGLSLRCCLADEDEDIVKQLVAAGAKIDIVDSEGLSAIEHATNEDVRAALGLQAKAPVTGKSPATFQARRASNLARDPTGRRASVANVTQNVASLFDAVCRGDIEEVVAALNAGVPVDSADDDKNTPLIIAAEGEDGIVEELLKRGAHVDSQNNNGVTALVRGARSADSAR